MIRRNTNPLYMLRRALQSSVQEENYDPVYMLRRDTNPLYMLRRALQSSVRVEKSTPILCTVRELRSSVHAKKGHQSTVHVKKAHQSNVHVEKTTTIQGTCGEEQSNPLYMLIRALQSSMCLPNRSNQSYVEMNNSIQCTFLAIQFCMSVGVSNAIQCVT